MILHVKLHEYMRVINITSKSSKITYLGKHFTKTAGRQELTAVVERCV